MLCHYVSYFIFLKLCIGQICDSDSVILKFWKYINNAGAYKEIPASCDKEASHRN